MASKQELLDELARCVLEMEDELVVDVANEYINAGFDAYEGIVEGLSRGMEQAGELYEQEEYFVPELLIRSDAMYNGLEVMRPHLKIEEGASRCPVLIGVVEGDTHDIGKNLVRIMMETAGFDVHDLGRDVPIETFVAKAKELGGGIICMSTLMTTTMDNMRKVIVRLKEEGIRDKYRIMIGGGPLSKSFADKIEADAYTHNAAEAAKEAKNLAEALA